MCREANKNKLREAIQHHDDVKGCEAVRKPVWVPLLKPLLAGEMPGHETRLTPTELQQYKCVCCC